MRGGGLNRLFIAALLFVEILYWVMEALLHGKWMDSYFVNDYHNTGMDYFNMLACLNTDNPYSADANYPPMCFLFLKIFYCFLPESLTGGDGFYYRELMQAQILYLMYVTATVLLVWELVKHLYRGSKWDKTLLAAGILFSGPFLFTLERGNLILASFAGLFVFLVFYDAPEKWKRYCAYLALAFAASLKIYPAVFGIFILHKKRYREAVWAAVAGAVVFFVPFFAFDGVASMGYLIHGIQASTDYAGNLGMAYNFSYSNLVKILGALCKITVQEPVAGRLAVPVAVCGAVYVLGKEEWKKLYALALFCVWLPSFSYTYTLLLFLFPVLFCLKEGECRFAFFPYLYRMLFLFLMVPLCLPGMGYLDEGIKFPLTMPTLVVNLAICMITALILTEGIMEWMRGKQGQFMEKRRGRFGMRFGERGRGR